MSNFGKINLILGCMFSSKTSTLISRYNRYSIGKKNCLLVKHATDNRYDNEGMMSTHDGIKIKAVSCYNLCEVDSIVNNYDVICIDEIQFYKDGYIYCDKWANEGLIVEACGLNGNYKREPFEIITKLVPLANNITFLTAVCRETGKDGIYSKRVSNDEGDIVIGGDDKYIAADRTIYFSDLNPVDYHVQKFVEYCRICGINNSIMDKGVQHLKKGNITFKTKIDYTDIINHL